MKRGKLALVVASAVLSLTACTAVGADKLGVEYSAGVSDGVHYNRVVSGADGDIYVGNDDLYQVPVGLRTYILDADNEKADVRQDISVPSSDQTTVVDFKVVVSFVLNTRTDDIKGFEGGTLRQFMEKVCLNDKCINPDNPDDTSGWSTMLQKRMLSAVQSSFKDVARGYASDFLVYNLPTEFSDDSGKKVMDKDGKPALRPTQDVVKEQAGRRFGEELKRNFGGVFFCGPSFDRNNKDPQQACPSVELTLTKVEYNNPELQKARESKRIAGENAEAKQVEAQSITDFQAKISAALRDPAYVEYLKSQNQLEAAKACAASAKSCVLILGNGGANVNVPAHN